MKENLTQILMNEAIREGWREWMAKVRTVLPQTDAERPVTWIAAERLARDHGRMVRLVELLREHRPVLSCRVQEEAGLLILVAYHRHGSSADFLLDTVTAGEVPLGSEENILCITGGEGTGKSNYTAALVAGAIMERETDADLLGVRVEPNRKGRAVLLYDTEQSEQQLYKNTGRLLRRAGRERMPEYLHVYCLTGMSRSERLTAIVQSMDKYHYLHGGIHLVVIDGVADLIRCANDEAESVALIDEIYRLAGIYRTCIAAVVHFVPNGLKLRGHLGSELQRKSAAILSIEKDENPEVSVVKALKVRDGSPLDIPLMQFRWDKQAGMPVYVGEKPRAEKEKRKKKELAEMAREAFARQEKYGYIELCELIQEMLEVKERTAKGYIRYMREKEIIEKEGDCYVHGQGRV